MAKDRFNREFDNYAFGIYYRQPFVCNGQFDRPSLSQHVRTIN